MNFSIANILIVGGAAVALCSCASAPKANNNDDARARAQAAYAETENSGSQAAPVPPTVPVSCTADYGLRGRGIADSYQAALLVAQRDIAAQIESSVKSKTEMTTRSDTDAEGNEILQSSFEVQSSLLTKLENAQDAKTISTEEKDGKFTVEACMSYADAAFPFKKKFSSLLDSVKLGVALFEKQTNPLQKHETYKNAKAQYVNMKAVAHILEGLGSADPAVASIDASFEQVKANYTQFRSNFAMYLDAPAAEASQDEARLLQILSERVTKNLPVRRSACANGIKLTPAISSAVCKEGSLGVSCSAEASLQGASCEGEVFFNLNTKVKGTGRYDEKEARERLDKNIADGAWFDDWKKELSKWKLN